MESKKDKIIKSTDLDALSCRYFADKYLQDPLIGIIFDGVKRYLPLSSPINLSIQRNLKTYFSNGKTPIINRGTYIRTQSINIAIDQFLKHHDDVQVISIGAGSDTRFFNLLQRYRDEKKIKVFEYDFENSVKVKKLTVVNNDVLRSIVNFEGDRIPISTHDEFETIDPNLRTLNYSLSPIDLRELSPSSFANVDPEKPTIILSECVLCYMSIEESKRVITTLTDLISRGMFIIYEPMGGDGNFGQVMMRNLSSRGIELPSLMEFHNLEKQYTRFRELGKFSSIKINDLNFVYHNWIADDELKRINRLEFLDEIEEMDLINRHYCLCLAQWGNLDLSFDQKFQIDK